MEILKYPHPALRYKCKPVATVDFELIEIISEMTKVDGLGIAANQIGLPYRIFTLNCREQPVIFINPVILHRKGRNNDIPEGCLSIPNFNVKINRSSEITIEAHDITGKVFKDTFKDLEAVCVQHEMDHLNGKLITDYAEKSDKMLADIVLKRLKEEYKLDDGEETAKLKELVTWRCRRLDDLS